MDAMLDTMTFFGRRKVVYPLYALFQDKLLFRFPETRIKVQKSQISFYNRHLYACLSFLKVKKRLNCRITILPLRWGCLHRWNRAGWQLKRSRIPGDGQRILSSAAHPNWMMNCLTWLSRHFILLRQNKLARKSYRFSRCA